MEDKPQVWADLLEALELLSQHPTEGHPFNCEHDILYVGADPDAFTPEEIQRLDDLGFFVDTDIECFASFRYGSA